MNTPKKTNRLILFLAHFFPSLRKQAMSALESAAEIEAINKVQAIIKFDMNGTILDANENFLELMGYRLDEITGKQHRICIEEQYADSEEYQKFWSKLNRGESCSAEFKCVGKNDKEIWLQASCNPIFNSEGDPIEVIQLASDITAQKQAILDYQSQIDSVNKSQAVIEFNMDGNILTANDNFLSLVGYTLDEIKGKHHRIFVSKEDAASNEYTNFWEKLKRGEFQSAAFKRIGKNGKKLWIQAAYNPIFDSHGKPFKVVKYAFDISDRKETEERLRAREMEIKNTAVDLQERIKLFRTIVSDIEGGDLTKAINVTGKDDLSALGHHLNAMTEGLRFIATSIIDVSHDLSTSVEELTGTIMSQANSAAEQATAVTEIGSIVEQIAQTSQQTLEKASALRKSSKITVDEGNRGTKVIKEVLESMDTLQEKMHQIANTILNLSDKTQQIGKITDAVSDIAKQSKMLALNASIEAAKAGESGKGFAVVADEVKDLADRSQAATENVQEILQDIRKTAEHAVMITEDGTKCVDANVMLAESAGTIISKLSEVIQESSTASQQIVTAVKEESIGIDQVVTSIGQIDKAANQFNDATEDSKRSIDTLNEASNSLLDTVSKYKVQKAHSQRKVD